MKSAQPRLQSDLEVHTRNSVTRFFFFPETRSQACGRTSRIGLPPAISKKRGELLPVLRIRGSLGNIVGAQQRPAAEQPRPRQVARVAASTQDLTSCGPLFWIDRTNRVCCAAVGSQRRDLGARGCPPERLAARRVINSAKIADSTRSLDVWLSGSASLVAGSPTTLPKRRREQSRFEACTLDHFIFFWDERWSAIGDFL